MKLSKTFIWRKLRERKILAAHKRTAAICEQLLEDCKAQDFSVDLVPKKSFDTARIIWQYWAQGYENVPEVVAKCLKSVEEFASDYQIVRLTDENLGEYLDLPEYVKAKRGAFSRAFFSDLLRVMLLKTYGGVWLDATIFFSGPIPTEYAQAEFFLFQRDPDERDIKYWRNVYAYYYGWSKGFRVNMLSSFIVARKGNGIVSRLSDAMLYWVKNNNYLPDYFFLQILFDVLPKKPITPLVSDCIPHYLQQSMNDPGFRIMSRKDILEKIHIHKLTYK